MQGSLIFLLIGHQLGCLKNLRNQVFLTNTGRLKIRVTFSQFVKRSDLLVRIISESSFSIIDLFLESLKFVLCIIIRCFFIKEKSLITVRVCEFCQVSVWIHDLNWLRTRSWLLLRNAKH